MIRTLEILAIALQLIAGQPIRPDEYVLHQFERVPLTDVYFSEGANFGDLDRDGVMDIVYGPFWFAGPDYKKQSPMWDAGAVVYWFKLVRSEAGVDWLPFRADGESGIGRQLIVGDVTGDKLPDIVVGGMKGSHVLIHRRQSVGRETWEKAQPKSR